MCVPTKIQLHLGDTLARRCWRKPNTFKLLHPCILGCVSCDHPTPLVLFRQQKRERFPPRLWTSTTPFAACAWNVRHRSWWLGWSLAFYLILKVCSTWVGFTLLCSIWNYKAIQSLWVWFCCTYYFSRSHLWYVAPSLLLGRWKMNVPFEQRCWMCWYMTWFDSWTHALTVYSSGSVGCPS